MIVMPIVVCLLIAAFGMSGFINLSNFYLKRVVLKQNSHRVSEKIRARVRELIQTNQICEGYDFSVLKDASSNPGAPFVFDKAKLVPCFLTEEEASWFKTIKLTITRIARAIDPSTGITKDSLLAQTMVQTQLDSVTDSSPSFVESVNRQLIISLATPMSFAAIFRGNGNLISLSPKGSLVVSGKTLVSNGNGLGIDLDTFVTPAIMEKRDGDVLFEDILYQTAKGVYSSKIFNNDSFLFHLRGGIQESSFSGISFAFDSGGSEWDQPLDYSYVYNDVGGYPLPGKISNASIGDNGYKPMNSKYAALNYFPNEDFLKNLDQTCEASSSSVDGSARMMVFLNKSRDLNLDFTNSNVFCGLIVAKVLNIKIPDGSEVAIYGHVNVAQLHVEGNGKVYIVNPYDYKSSPLKAVLPSAASIQSLVPTLDSLKTTVAHNFFIPIGNAPSSFAPELFSAHFESCGSSQCWSSYVQSPDVSALYVPNWYKNLKMVVMEAL